MNLVKLGGVEAGLTLATDKEGRQVLVVVVKATYAVLEDGRCRLTKPQIPPTEADVSLGEPGESSIVDESDYATFKPKTDVLLKGHAYAPGGKPTEVVDVQMTVGPVSKSIRVFGDRLWKPALVLGYELSSPVPFVKMPLIYERAFGGVDHRPNPVGRGLHRKKSEKVQGTLLPNLENPKELIRNPFDTPGPAGFGPLGRAWLPRATYAGTCDEAWKEKRFPFLPEDFDDRYFQAAPADQVAGPLRGGEKVVLKNLTPEGVLEFALPKPDIAVQVVGLDDVDEDLPCVLDTVLLDPDRRRVSLVWRATWRPTVKPTRILEVRAGAVTPARRHAREKGKRFVDWTATS